MRIISIAFILGLMIVSCTKTKENSSSKSETVKTSVVKSEPIYGIGPNGEKPSTIEDLEKIVSKIKKDVFADKEYSIIVAMHDVQNDWSQTVIAGIKDVLTEYGLTISLITDGEFNVEKQIADYNQILKMNVDILITLSVDAEKTSPILKKIKDKGAKVIFIDALPNDFKPGENCVGWAVGDCYTMGKAGSEMLYSSLIKKKKVALLHWKSKMFTVDRRSDGANDFFNSIDKKIDIKNLYFDGFHEIEKVVNSALNKDKEIEGFWVVWDSPAMEVLTEIKKRELNINIVTADLSKELAEEISKDTSNIIGTIADDPFTIGKVEGLLAVATLENIAVPGYYVTPVFKVDRSNLREAWKYIYREDLPNEILKNLE